MRARDIKEFDPKGIVKCCNCNYTDIVERWKSSGGCPECGSLALLEYELPAQPIQPYQPYQPWVQPYTPLTPNPYSPWYEGGTLSTAENFNTGYDGINITNANYPFTLTFNDTGGKYGEK